MQGHWADGRENPEYGEFVQETKNKKTIAKARCIRLWVCKQRRGGSEPGIHHTTGGTRPPRRGKKKTARKTGFSNSFHG